MSATVTPDVVSPTRKSRVVRIVVFGGFLYTWAEMFVLFGLQYAWILYKSYPLPTEGLWSLVAASVPFAVMIFVGLATSFDRSRVILIRLEPALHLSTSACLLILLLTVASYDPFDMLVPYSWPFYWWTFTMSFLGLANVARHQRRLYELAAGTSEDTWWIQAAVAVLVWGVALTTAIVMKTVVWYWLVAIIAHAWMAPYAAVTWPSTHKGAPRPWRPAARLSAGFETGALGLVLLIVSMHLSLVRPMLGALEIKNLEAFQTYVSPCFFAGVLVAVLARRCYVSWIGHSIVVAITAFAGDRAEMAWPALLGYALAALFVASGSQGVFGYAMTTLGMSVVWVLVAAGYAFSGMVSGDALAKAVSQPINTYAPAVMLGFFGVALVFRVIGRLQRSHSISHFVQVPAPSAGQCVLTYTGLIVAFTVPTILLVALRSIPPLRMHRADRISVEEPTGVCHADPRSEYEAATLHTLGVSTLRYDFHWSQIQSGPDSWSFDGTDAYVDAAQKNGMRVLGLFAYDNNAVERSPGGKQRDHYIAPDDIPLFLEYVKRTVTRYKDRVYAWEIWNEPSLRRFWEGTDEEYYRFALQVAKTAREVDPNARIVGTAMHAPLGVWLPYQIEGLYTHGVMAEVDHPSFHIYLPDPRAYGNEFARILALRNKYGHAGSPWITELGDPDGGGYPWRASSDQLADHVIKSYVTSTSYGIEKLMWYCLEDSRSDDQRKHPNDSEGFFGLLGPGGQWKPAANAYRLFSSSCSRSEIRSDLLKRTGGLTARQLRATLFRRQNGDSALILWYEPVLVVEDSVRVALNLGDITGTPVVHDIDSSYTKDLLDSVVNVSERPLFITFHAATADALVHIGVRSAVSNTLVLFVLAVICVSSCIFTISIWRRDTRAAS